MRELFRVIPYDESAAPNDRGGALFVPAGGANRIDNPNLYDVLYVATSPEAAVAESFGRIPLWTPETFVHGSGRPYRLAAYAVSDDLELFNLDDVDALKTIGVTHPSSVVTRDRAKTQAWAKTIFELGRYAGASWWSYYSPDWTVLGLWDRSAVNVIGTPEILTATRRLVKDTAAAIVRQIAP